MAKKLIIVHGYSDGYMQKENSFRRLHNFLVRQGAYQRANIHFVEYSSMDDQATFEDFADKLDSDFEKKIQGERVDVLCHSTGVLVVRAWLARRRRNQRERGLTLDLPVDRLFMFAPANFGSDLARMGQSFLGKLRCTFFNKNAQSKDFWESGKIVLQGLEPASPYQWALSMYDLHEESYFGPNDESGLHCFPFVFAAGESYRGAHTKVIKARNKPGTDGTVRICGTSLNTRKCTLLCTDKGTEVCWGSQPKYSIIPFSIFQGFNHGSIINPDKNEFLDTYGPGTLLLKALKVNSLEQYRNAVRTFQTASEENYKNASARYRDRYQQFFFKVRDDAGFSVDDFFIDFRVENQQGRKIQKLSRRFDKSFQTKVTVHSQDRSMRAMLVNLRELKDFMSTMANEQARIVLEITARRPYDEVSYDVARFTVYDSTLTPGGQPTFLFENTTTLVEIVMNRRPSDKVLKIRKSLTCS